MPKADEGVVSGVVDLRGARKISDGGIMKSRIIVGVVVVAAIFGLCFSIVRWGHAAPAYTCVAGPDEQCASDQFVADYKKLRAMQAKYSPPQDVSDEITGIASRLQKQIPPGYDWSDKKLRFVKLPVQAPAPTPAVPPVK